MISKLNLANIQELAEDPNFIIKNINRNRPYHYKFAKNILHLNKLKTSEYLAIVNKRKEKEIMRLERTANHRIKNGLRRPKYSYVPKKYFDDERSDIIDRRYLENLYNSEIH